MEQNGFNYSSCPVGDLWHMYTSNCVRDERVRNELAVRYLDIVRFTAERLHQRLPSEVDLDDLMSAGFFGLKDAIDAFDPNRGVKFETYCAQRIRGAIFDELRATDWVPRLVRARTAKLDRIKNAFRKRFGREPTIEELREETGVSESDFEKLLKDSMPTGKVSLSRKKFETDSNKTVTEADTIKDESLPDPDFIVEGEDIRKQILFGLSRIHKIIIKLYHFEGYTMKQIGDLLFMSESRISQLHDSAIAQIRAKEHLREIFESLE